MQNPIIFLDFDGVLHPGLAGTLIYRDLFSEFLAKHAAVRVVFSTSWRLNYPFLELRSLFPTELRSRFLGITPNHGNGYGPIRENEINAWRSANNHLGRWVALDDEATLFSSGCPNLVLCESIRGLRKAQLSAIEQKLALA